MRNFFVNISMVSYNQESIIEESVLSCINQDYNNYKIIISDDGSTDSTPLILERLQKKYSDKLEVIFNKENQGITKNSNVALSACKGELIAFCAGDDIIYPSKISQQVEEFRKNKKLTLCYHPSHVSERGVITGVIGNRNKDILKSVYDVVSNYGADMPAPSVMILRDAIPEYGFNESLPVASDWMLYIDMAAKGDTIRIAPILSQYRKHDSNIGKKLFTYADEFLKTLEIVSVKYKDIDIENSVIMGRKRFLLGVLYNAAMCRNLEAFNKYLSIYHSFGYSGSTLLRILNSPWVSVMLPRLRSTLKKFV